MIIKRFLLAIGLVCAAGASSLFCIANSPSSNSAIEAKAEATPSTTTIYVEVCDTWHEANAVPRLYVSPAASSWVKPASTIKAYNPATSQHALYSFNVPAGVTSFFIYRMNPNNADSSGGVWNSTESIDYSSSYNYYNVTSLNSMSSPYSPGWMNVFWNGVANHQDFQLTVINEDYNWFDANAATWIRFWDGTEIRFERLISYYGSAINTNTLRCSTLGLAGPIYAAGFNIFRKSSDGTETWSQTGNWAFTHDNKDMNAFVIKAKKAGDAQFYDGEGQSKVIGPEYNAMAYGIYFLENTNSICYGNENNNNLSALSPVWTKLEAVASTSTNGTYLLKSKEEMAAFQTSTEAYTLNAFQRYSHIVRKYHPSLSAFVEINPLLSSRSANNNLNSGYDFTIIIVGTVSLAIIGTSFVLIKRKKLER